MAVDGESRPRCDSWPLESDGNASARDTIALLLRLVDVYTDAALIICDSRGRVLWASKEAVSMASFWGASSDPGGEMVVDEYHLKNVRNNDSSTSIGKNSRHSYLLKDEFLCDVKRMVAIEVSAQSQLIVLSVQSHALVNNSERVEKQLSPSEYHLITLLNSHCSLKETAADLDISYENARTKLKHIFHKLDVHSQSELLKKISVVAEEKARPVRSESKY